jgi:hypothetical protein
MGMGNMRMVVCGAGDEVGVASVGEGVGNMGIGK